MKPRFPYGWLCFLLLIACLFTAIIFGGGQPTPNLARLESIVDLLEKHPIRFWQQRPLLDATFAGATVRTDADGFRLAPSEPAGAFTVITLGASPTFGYGVEAEQTYAKVAEQMLRADDNNLRVINAGQIGYSSWQGLRLAEQYLPIWQPNLVTVSYVVNDIDRLRFFYSNGVDDAHTQPAGETKTALDNFFLRCRLTSFLQKRLRRTLTRLGGDRVYRGSYELTHKRVSADDYRANLLAFVELCRRHNTKLVLIKMPLRLPEPVPPAPEDAAAALDNAATLLAEKRFAEAKKAIDAVIAADSYASESYYLKGLALAGLDREDEANDLFKQAMQHLLYDCARDAARYNEIMQSVSLETQTPLINAAGSLGDEHGANVALFVKDDYIHPNADGHRLIGRCLARAIQKTRASDSGWFVERCSETQPKKLNPI